MLVKPVNFLAENLLGKPDGGIEMRIKYCFQGEGRILVAHHHPCGSPQGIDQQAGRNFFFGPLASDVVQTCNGCHRLDPAQGFFGSDGFSSFENETQLFKIAHLRNMYQKVGMFGMPAVDFFNSGDNGHKGPQVRGFGFIHDGSTDTLFRFLQATVFNDGGTFNPVGFTSDTQRRQVEQFVLAFDTNLAPIVGQQITLTHTNAATVGTRINLLLARAAAGECDVVVKGTIGWLKVTLKKGARGTSPSGL